jgi:hypothetical protein
MRCVATFVALPSILLALWSPLGLAQAPPPPQSQFESLRNKAGEAVKAKMGDRRAADTGRC